MQARMRPLREWPSRAVHEMIALLRDFAEPNRGAALGG